MTYSLENKVNVCQKVQKFKKKLTPTGPLNVFFQFWEKKRIQPSPDNKLLQTHFLTLFHVFESCGDVHLSTRSSIQQFVTFLTGSDFDFGEKEKEIIIFITVIIMNMRLITKVQSR